MAATSAKPRLTDKIRAERRKAKLLKIFAHAEEYVPGFNEKPMAAFLMPNSDTNWNVTTQYTWSTVDTITEVSMGRYGDLTMICTDSDGRKKRSVSSTIFNEVAQKLFDEALGIDPGNPLDAGFVPVSNRKSRR